MSRFTIRVRPLAADDPRRGAARYAAAIAEDPGFVHALGEYPAEALGLAVLYLWRVSDLSAGVRLVIDVGPAAGA